jgi:hypothetical protein
MKAIGYLFYKHRAKSHEIVRFSLTIDTVRIKEQDKPRGVHRL